MFVYSYMTASAYIGQYWSHKQGGLRETTTGPIRAIAPILSSDVISM